MNASTECVVSACLMLGLTLTGCNVLVSRPTSTYVTASGALAARQWTGRVHPFDAKSAERLLVFDALYVARVTDSQRTWFRFWPTGQVASGGVFADRGEIKAAHGNDLRSAHIGRYKVEGASITIELVVRAEGDTYFVHTMAASLTMTEVCYCGVRTRVLLGAITGGPIATA
jgi:hypothetical protein